MRVSIATTFISIVMCAAVMLFAGTVTPAQTNAQQRAIDLRAQLVDVQAREADLQTRLQQLEENLNPQNIENSLAGVGSVHPEDLRAARRRQLEIEKRNFQSQLEVLAASRARLESAIAATDAEVYQYYANAGGAANQTAANPAVRGAGNHRPKKRKSTK